MEDSEFNPLIIKNQDKLGFVKPSQVIYPMQITGSTNSSSDLKKHSEFLVKTVRPYDLHDHAQMESEITSHKLAASNTDGYHIVHQDHIAVIKSEIPAIAISNNTDVKLKAGLHFDDAIHSEIRVCTIPSAPPAYGSTTTSNNVDDFGLGKPYEIAEYKSNYDGIGSNYEPTGYKIQDYKSIYD